MMRYLVTLALLFSALSSSAQAQDAPQQDVGRATSLLASLRHKQTKTDADGNVFSLDISEQDNVSDSMLAAVQYLPHLREFYAIYCPIRGDGLANFAKLHELKKLDLFATRIDDRALKLISQIDSLTYLDVMSVSRSPNEKPRNGGITDDGVAYLSKLHNLETLRISGTITDQGLRSLAGLTRLRSLEIDSGEATATGIKDLQTAIPKLEIQWWNK